MDEKAVRAILVRGLEAGAVPQLFAPAARAAFLAGEDDLRFAALDMDSLARMELCIAIELATGVTIVPDELGSYESAGELARVLAARTGD